MASASRQSASASRTAPTRLRPLSPQEAWQAARHLTGADRHYSWNGVRCWEGNDLLFGSLERREDPSTTGRPGTTGLQQAAEAGFRELFACLETKGYPHLTRVWSYLPRINSTEQGLERYRQFNIGRQDAFAASGRSLTEGLPAASAVGSRGEALEIGFLAARQPVRSLENPRQISAFHYPEDYGPRSPTFARAALLMQPQAPRLFISGTAAIVGHRSLHADDVSEQARETVANLESMIGEANRALGSEHFQPRAMSYLVYLRQETDFPAVTAALESWLPGHRGWRLMRADICRRELRLEIEAMSTAD